jgi:iron complex outermembrane recepter protein
MTDATNMLVRPRGATARGVGGSSGATASAGSVRSVATPMSRLSALLAALVATAGFAQGALPPSVIENPPAVYPRGETQRVDVVLLVTVGSAGQVSAAEVVESAGLVFDQSALQAIKGWTFRPALSNGGPVSARIKVSFHFEPPPVATAPVPPAPGASGGAAATGPERVPTESDGGPTQGAPVLPPASGEPSPAAVEEVTVRGTRQVSRGGSDFQINLGELASTVSGSASDILQLAPGIFIANEGGAGHADTVFLRGFNAEQGQDIEFTFNGVPINEVDNPDGHGYADTHFIIPELVKSLRVIEGPFDPHQGDFAVAGSADYELGVDARGYKVGTWYGSFNTTRVYSIIAPPEARSGTFLGFQFWNTDGYGSNRAGSSVSAMGQYEGELGARGLWHVLATAYATHYQSAGVVRQDDYLSGKVGFYGTEDTSQGGDATRFTLAADVEVPLGDGVFKQQVFLTWRSLRIVEDFTGFLLDTQQDWQSLHGQRGDAIQQQYRALTVGGRGSYRMTGTWLGQPQALELGYYARYDHTTPDIDRLRFGTQIPYEGVEAYVTDVADIAGYVDVDFRPTRWLSFRGGLREEYFYYDVNNLCATMGNYNRGAPLDVQCPSYDSSGPRLPSTLQTAGGGLLEPKVTALVEVGGGFTLTASYGVGAVSSDAQYIFQNELAPFSKLEAVEGGVIYRRRFGTFDFSGRVVGYYTASDTEIFDPTLGRLSAAGPTGRWGFVGALRATGLWVDELASVTYANATFKDTGELVPYVPAWVARSDTAFFGSIPGLRLGGSGFTGTLGIRLNFIGERALPFSQFAPSIFTIDANASVRWKFIELGVRVENLTNLQYAQSEFFYASNFNSRLYPTLAPAAAFTAAPPRTIFLTLALIFGETR